MARIAIIGPGAVGGIVAAWLIKTGRHEVALCARQSFPELLVDSPAGPLRSQPAVLTDPGSATPVDWVLVATKAYDAAGAAAWFPRLTGSATRVAILQNGVEHRERFAAALRPEQLVPVMVDIPAERTAPGVIRQRAHGRMLVGDDASGRDFVALFAGTIIDTAVTPDFRSVVWRKLCHNSAGVLNALLSRPNEVFHDDGVADLARGIVRECAAVGRAEGAILDADVADAVVAAYRAAAPDGVNSLLADRLARRPMELDARNGVIVRLGRRHGIPTPCNQMAVTLLETLARSPA